MGNYKGFQEEKDLAGFSLLVGNECFFLVFYCSEETPDSAILTKDSIYLGLLSVVRFNALSSWY